MSSNGKTDEVLGAILKCLDAMDGKLSRLDPISDKVTALEAATGELGAHQDMLATTVERVDRVHAALAMQVNQMDPPTTSDPTSCRLANGGGRRADDDNNHGGDFVPTAHKLEFLKFVSDLVSWLNRCECYFHRPSHIGPPTCLIHGILSP
jgi:hypothetical protein